MARADFERGTRVLLEQIRSDVRTVAEGHGVLSSKLDQVVGCLDKVEGRLDKVEGCLDKVEGRLVRVEGELTAVKVAVIENHHQLERLDHKLDLSIGLLDKRLKTLEVK